MPRAKTIKPPKDLHPATVTYAKDVIIAHAQNLDKQAVDYAKNKDFEGASRYAAAASLIREGDPNNDKVSALTSLIG